MNFIRVGWAGVIYRAGNLLKSAGGAYIHPSHLSNAQSMDIFIFFGTKSLFFPQEPFLCSVHRNLQYLSVNTNYEHKCFFFCCWYTFLFKSTLLLCMENMIGLGAKPGYRRTHTLLVRGKKHFPGSTPERMDYGRCLFFFIPPQFSKF